MNFSENIRIALRSIKANWLRSLLTLSIIALGLMSLVGILTAIDGLLQSISDSFNRIGASSFTVERTYENIKSKTQGRRRVAGKVIAFRDAMEFKKRYNFPGSKVSIDLYNGNGFVCSYNKEETNPNLKLTGVDENYIEVSAFELEAGRGFTLNEINNSNSKIIIGSAIAEKLFAGNAEKALGKIITFDDYKYMIIGVTKSKGSAFGDSNDRRAMIPITKAREIYGTQNSNYSVTTSIEVQTSFDDAISSAMGVMRNVRGLRPIDENDFTIKKSSSLMTQIKDITKTLRLATIAIGLMTLVGAAIGLMNIMLVSVTERTKEIGVSKALGATKRNILIQFLTEAVTITMMGGIIGIILGLIVGNIVTFVIGQSFIFPFAWVALGLFVCICTGVLSGLYPALKAASLDPIESLRYE